MSTRSKKRMHNSLHENIVTTNIDDVLRSERKTRSKRMKKNLDELSVSIVKGKKRNNYVAYPTDDEVGNESGDNIEDETKVPRVLRKNALKERNTMAAPVVSEIEPKPSRATRRTRKLTDKTEDVPEPTEETSKVQKPKNKSKKKKNSTENEEVVVKKKSKKKKGRSSGSMIVEDIVPVKKDLNKSDMSIESFHSATTSPVKNSVNIINQNLNIFNEDIMTNDDSEESSDKDVRKTRSGKQLNFSVIKRKRKSSTKCVTEESVTESTPNKKRIKVSLNKSTNIDDTVDTAAETIIPIKLNSAKKGDCNKLTTQSTIYESFEKSTEVEQDNNTLTIHNTTFDKDNENEDITLLGDKTVTAQNTTYDKEINTVTEQNDKDVTFEKESNRSTNKIYSINSTFEKTNSSRNSLKNATFDKDSSLLQINTTYEKDKSSIDTKNSTANGTFDIETKSKDATFDKESKSSLISSDNSNITLDKSDVRISITSDDSAENIVNTTPVLIESSLDESQIKPSETPLKEPITPESKTPTPKCPESKISTPKAAESECEPDIRPEFKPETPLKREGTFTKESPEASTSSPMASRSPARKMSLPSPGCTPFPKSSSKQTIMNVTRSIEKSRRSSVADPQPRHTRVMFCSPVNNPAVVAQQKRKVIKSNLKGSNKSFVFDESCMSARAGVRKRSLTQCEGEAERAKRTRLGDTHHAARSRTTSASGKLTETPSKRTPKKSDSKITRTKLPNFAALHQKEFAKMESLDECQERRAKRAKQLLTPTGSVNMIDKISPKETETKPKEQPKKPETPVKSLPTLKSLNPGYTRFGFKLNLDVNPFSIVNKNVPKPKVMKPNGLPREAALPSTTGATSARKDLAKQTVMREKSFSDRRSVKRAETRTVIKGVRTNRRFELQMRMRNID